MKRALLLAAVVIVVVVIALLRGPGDQPSPPVPESNLTKHPVYSSYDFGRTDQVVNIGTQPLYVPTGMITAAMARDGVLAEQLAARGLEIRFFPFLKGQDVNFFLGDGSLDAGIGGDMPVLVAAATLDVVVTTLAQMGSTSIVGGRDMFVGELRGKRIAYAAESNAHFALLTVLASEGISEEQVHLIPMDADEMPGALLDGAIDAFAAWEPFVSLSLGDDPSHAVVQRSLSSGYLYFSQRFADQHPEVVQEIVAAEFRAIAWLAAGAEHSLDASAWAIADGLTLTATASAISPSAMVAMAARDLLGLGLDVRVPRSFLVEDGRLAAEFAFLQGLGKITASATWELTSEAFDAAIAAEIVADREQFRLRDFQYDLGRETPR